MISGARSIHAGHLPDHLDELDRNAQVTTICASGARATIAASVPKRAGFEKVDVFLGPMGAWKASERPVVKPG